jgi:hypothetical protein
MAWIIQISDGTTTFDCNDASNTFLNPGGFQAPAPARRLSMAGANLSRDGSTLVARRYLNRMVTINFQLKGSSTDDLASRIQSVETVLRKAVAYSMEGLGSQMQVKLQWDSASNPVYFNILEGSFNLGANALSHMLTLNNRLVNVQLQITCEPFAVGTEETLENFLTDPGFEFTTGTLFADWTVNNGTRAVDTSAPPEGLNWGKVTANASTAQVEIKQTQTMTAGHHVFSVTYKVTGNQSYEAFISDSGGTTVAALTEDGTQRIATATRDSGANTAITAGVRTTGNVSDTDDVILLDKAYLGDGTTAPTAWVSGRALANYFEDSTAHSQARVNYLDIEDVPGDVPALMQVRLAENEAHTHLWMGARHDTRQRDAGLWHEGQDFATWDTEPSEGTASGGNYGRSTSQGAYDATSESQAQGATSITLAHNCSGLKRILWVWVSTVDGDSNADAHSGVTYDGVAMTQAGKANNTAGGDHIGGSLWYLVGPSTGSDNIVASFGATMDHIVLQGVSLTGIDQTTPIASPVETATGTSTSATDTIGGTTTLRKDSIIVNGMTQHDYGTLTAGTGVTERNDQIDSANQMRSAMGTMVADADTETVAWTILSAEWCMVTVECFPDGVGQASTPVVKTKAIASPSEGLFRVLTRAANPDGTTWNLSMGYGYGDITKTPSVAIDYTQIASSLTAFHILDIGSLTIPPIELPIGTTMGPYTPRLAFYKDVADGAVVDLDVDWVFFLPADEGFIYVSKTSATDVVLVDSRSKFKGVSLVNTSDVLQSVPADQAGTAPTAHPGGTRLYCVSDNGAADIADGWKAKITLLPRYLHVAEA